MQIDESPNVSHKSADCPCCSPVLDPEACPCTTGISGKFLEPVLMLLLSGVKAHGYELLGQLGDFKISADTSALYRTLRSLEGRELVQSEWDTERTGPARRLYSLTASGQEYLKGWVFTVREDRERLDRFLTGYHEEFSVAGTGLIDHDRALRAVEQPEAGHI